MTKPFDPGPVHEPFFSLCQDFPGEETYPARDFRVEWGPVFHRGRLDGSARILVLGQDPATHEAITRRILVGEAGQRVQGFLGKLGITRSYVMVNTFLYSVYGQWGGARHKDDPGIIAYRNLWLEALLLGGNLQAVVALGGLADRAWHQWVAARGAEPPLAYAHITHPTWPESSSGGNKAKHLLAVSKMLQNWNEEGLQKLATSISSPDEVIPLALYGDAFGEEDLQSIPSEDLPPGLPDWMGGLNAWARRSGSTAEDKRANITVNIPAVGQVWKEGGP